MKLADRILITPYQALASPWQEAANYLRALIKPKKTALRFSLPDVTAVMGLLLSAGLPVSVAIGWLAPRCSGEIAKLLQAITENLELGADIVSELDELQSYGDPGLSELAEKLKLMIERGASVSSQVLELALTLRSSLYRELLAKAGSNETKMLIPTVFLILPVTVLFALFPSLIVLQQSI
jgi:tight adherence protein C